MNPYLFNLLNGIALVTIGIWSRSLDFKYSMVFMLLGAIIIALTYFVRRSHVMLGSLAMGSTILATVFLAFLFIGSASAGSLLQAPVGMMMISGMVSSAAFVQCAFNHNSTEEEKGCCVNSNDDTSKVGCC